MQGIGKWLDVKARNALRRTGFPHRLARFLRDEWVRHRRSNRGRAGEANRAHNALETAEAREAERIDCVFRAARTLWEEHECEEAIELLEREYAQSPASARSGELLIDLVSCCARAGDWNRCIKHHTRHLAFCEQQLAESPIADFPYRFIGERFYATHFGHIGHLEFIYKLAELGLLPKYRLLIDLRGQPVNRHLLGYWMEKIPCIAKGLTFHDPLLDAALSLEINAVRLADGRFLSIYEYPCVAQEAWDLQARPPVFQLTAEDRAFGEGVLREMGIPDGAWFVAAHARYAMGGGTVRNVDVASYFEAFRVVADRGGWVFRVGDPSMPKLPPMERVVDYAHSPWRSDRMDTFLFAAAKFFIGCASGPASVPSCFGVPVIFTNMLFYEMMPGADQIVLPRIHCERGSDTPVPFARVLQTPYALAGELTLLEKSELYARPNSAAEIREAVEEMVERLEGTFAPPLDYDDLQDRWRATYASFTPIRGRCPVGLKYADRYRNLL